MRLHPLPVVMVSTLTSKGSEVTLKALEAGAVDFVTKPQIGIRETMMSYRDVIGEKSVPRPCQKLLSEIVLRVQKRGLLSQQKWLSHCHPMFVIAE